MRKNYQIILLALLFLFLLGCNQESEEDECYNNENEQEHDYAIQIEPEQVGEPEDSLDVVGENDGEEFVPIYLGEEIWAIFASVFEEESLLAFRSYQIREREKTESGLHQQIMIEGQESNEGVQEALDNMVESIHARQGLIEEQQVTMAEVRRKIDAIEGYLNRLEESSFREDVIELQRLFQERYEAFLTYVEYSIQAIHLELSLYTSLGDETQDLRVIHDYVVAINNAYRDSQTALQEVYEITNQIGEIKQVFIGFAEGEVPTPYNFAQDLVRTRDISTIMEFNGYTRRIAYLTFDDGPSYYMGAILDILAEFNVQATFFVIGVNLANPGTHDNVRRAVAKGHYVGAHSMTHNYSRIFEEGYGVQEMLEAIDLIEEITGKRPILTRFPFGTVPGMSESLAAQVQEAGLRVWDWTVDSLDWQDGETRESILQRTKAQIFRDREVILLHELAITVAILPELIEFLLEQGYILKAYDEDAHFPVNHLGNPGL